MSETADVTVFGQEGTVTIQLTLRDNDPLSSMEQALAAEAEKRWGAEAQRVYAAYGLVVGNKNYQGLPMPVWGKLTPRIRWAWCEATRTAASRM